MKVSKQKNVTGTNLPENFYDSNFKTLQIQAIYFLSVVDPASGARAAVAHGRKKTPMFVAYMRTNPSTTWNRKSQLDWQGAVAGNRCHVYADAANLYLDSNFVDDLFFPKGSETTEAMVFVFTNDLE